MTVHRTHTPVDMQPRTGDRDSDGDAKLVGRPNETDAVVRHYSRPAAVSEGEGVLDSQPATVVSGAP